jgi:GTP pyrophosphokinase
MRSLQHLEGVSSVTNGAERLAEVSDWCRALVDRVSPGNVDMLERIATERLDILRGIDAEIETQVAVWLYGAWELVDLDAETVARRFGASTASLVQGIKKMDAISSLTDGGGRGDSDENFRKMLISMIDDVRVVLVRLACQLQLMRQARTLDPEYQLRLGRETLEVFAPLANRLGIWQFKWELEDFAFRFVQPRAYKELAGHLAERRVDRERYIEAFMDDLRQMLGNAGIQCDVAGRPKHIYSIYRKMQKKHLDFAQITDVRAVRILVDSVADCYAALGLVHTGWRHIPGEFDDYIATPKENGYRSIHTAVIGPQGKVVEVQIRTFEMHDDNELGVAAHWRYKERSRQDQATDSKVLWLRQLLEWKQEVGEGSEFFERFRNDTAQERVYVFSPQGKVVDLPLGSTPIDFAYAIHTDIGHHCRGAKVGGRMVPLNHALRTGDQVEILTLRSGTPSRDWLNAALGYVKTQKARSRIQRWFKSEAFEQNLAAGRAALERELDRLGVQETPYDKLAAHQGFQKVDDFLAAIGSGDLRLSQAVSSLRPTVDRRESLPTSLPSVQGETRFGRGMSVQGVDNLLIQFAACCHPLPGDRIVGYITRSRGITVHRHDCANIARLDAIRGERVIPVEWGAEEDAAFPVDIEIWAFDRKGLLYDISRVFHDSGINVLSTASESHARDHAATMRIRAEIRDVEQLSRLLTQLGQVPNVRSARRVGSG